MSKTAGIDIHRTAYIAPDGTPLKPLPDRLTDSATLTALYRGMVLARTFDARAIALQRTGRLGTYASLLGQEAVGVGIAQAMRMDDVLLPSFREHALQIQRGVKPEELLLYWGGDERGSNFSGPLEDFPVGITVGGHAPQAAGVALAFKLRGEPRAAVCVFGDGATSKGDFYEALNVAGGVAAAGGVRDGQQPLGDLYPAQRADSSGNAGAEGGRGRYPGRAGGRQ